MQWKSVPRPYKKRKGSWLGKKNGSERMGRHSNYDIKSSTSKMVIIMRPSWQPLPSPHHRSFCVGSEPMPTSALCPPALTSLCPVPWSAVLGVSLTCHRRLGFCFKGKQTSAPFSKWACLWRLFCYAPKKVGCRWCETPRLAALEEKGRSRFSGCGKKLPSGQANMQKTSPGNVET